MQGISPEELMGGGRTPKAPKLKPATPAEIAVMSVDDLKKYSREAMAIATFYPASFVLPVDTLANRIAAAQAEQNPVLKIARFAHAANHADAVSDPAKAESFKEEWRTAMEQGQAQIAVARQIVEEAQNTAKRQPAESIEALRKRQRENRPLHVVEQTSIVNGVSETSYQIVMPTLNRFYDTAEGQGTKEGKKAIAGKFDWGAVLAMLVATINKKTHKADHAWESDMKEFAATKPLGLEVEAFRDPSTGQLTFKGKGKDKDLSRDKALEVAEEFNLYLKEKYKKNQHETVSVDVKDSTTRVEVNLSAGGSAPATTASASTGAPAPSAPSAVTP